MQYFRMLLYKLFHIQDWQVLFKFRILSKSILVVIINFILVSCNTNSDNAQITNDAKLVARETTPPMKLERQFS